MSKESLFYPIEFAHDARMELDEIWNWNKRRYDEEHANQYTRFLRSEIDLLSTDPHRGKHLSGSSVLRHLVIRRKHRGNGHIAIYEIREKTVYILHVFHTSQDW